MFYETETFERNTNSLNYKNIIWKHFPETILRSTKKTTYSQKFNKRTGSELSRLFWFFCHTKEFIFHISTNREHDTLYFLKLPSPRQRVLWPSSPPPRPTCWWGWRRRWRKTWTRSGSQYIYQSGSSPSQGDQTRADPSEGLCNNNKTWIVWISSDDDKIEKVWKFIKVKLYFKCVVFQWFTNVYCLR